MSQDIEKLILSSPGNSLTGAFTVLQSALKAAGEEKTSMVLPGEIVAQRL